MSTELEDISAELENKFQILWDMIDDLRRENNVLSEIISTMKRDTPAPTGYPVRDNVA